MMCLMLRIRLQRVGRKHDPHFRVVLTDQKNGPKSGRFLDVLGSYDAKAGDVQLNGEKIKEWIAKGAQVSDTVHNMLVSQKIIEGKKINVLPKKTPIVKEATEEEKAQAEVSEVKEAENNEENTGEKTSTKEPAEEIAEEKTETEKADAKTEVAVEEEKSDMEKPAEEKTVEEKEGDTDKEKAEEDKKEA